MWYDFNAKLNETSSLNSTKVQLLRRTEFSVLRLSLHDVSHPMHKTSLFRYQRHTGKPEPTWCLTLSGRTSSTNTTVYRQTESYKIKTNCKRMYYYITSGRKLSSRSVCVSDKHKNKAKSAVRVKNAVLSLRNVWDCDLASTWGYKPVSKWEKNSSWQLWPQKIPNIHWWRQSLKSVVKGKQGNVPAEGTADWGKQLISSLWRSFYSKLTDNCSFLNHNFDFSKTVQTTFLF